MRLEQQLKLTKLELNTRQANNAPFSVIWPPQTGCGDEVTRRCHPSRTPALCDKDPTSSSAI